MELRDYEGNIVEEDKFYMWGIFERYCYFERDENGDLKAMFYDSNEPELLSLDDAESLSELPEEAIEEQINDLEKRLDFIRKFNQGHNK